MKTQRRFVLCPGRHLCPVGFSAVLVCFTCLRNLDQGTDISFYLVSALSIFLIANISMISAFPAEKGVKKIAHAICHIVSRKAMQNYSRFTNWPNNLKKNF